MMTPNERSAHRAPTRRAPAIAAAGTPLFEPGEVVPGARLQVIKKLGEGGFGVVYECQDLDLQIPVAVKLLTTNAKTAPELLAVFLDESRALAKLDSDHVVRVRRFGVTDEPAPRPYLVMFKLEGSTLLDVLSTLGRFRERDVILYGIHIAMGLATAHAAGLVHRDIKPANVFLASRKDPISGMPVTFAVILDFGIAKAASSGAPDSKRLPIICSAPYCGPEQYHGRAYPQTDLYALAVTLFIMLTLEHPLGTYASDREWVRAKLVDRPKPQLVNEVIRELNLIRPSHKAKIALVDPELEELLDRSLSYDPADRPGTAEAFVRSLEIIQERVKAKDEAKLAAKGHRAPRGARTVPESPEQMAKRVTAEYARSNRAVPAAEPETVQSFRDLEERVERSKMLEEAVLGLDVDHPPLTDAEVDAIRAGKAQVRQVTMNSDVRQQLVIAGSTLESPHAAQRNIRKWSTASARVKVAEDAHTPVMEGAPAHPAVAPAAQPVMGRRGFTAANGSVISLPMSGMWLVKMRLEGWIDRNLLRPEKGRHWVAGLLWLALGFSAAATLVLLTTGIAKIFFPERWAAVHGSPPASSTASASVAAAPSQVPAGPQVPAVPGLAAPVASPSAFAPTAPTASAPVLLAPLLSAAPAAAPAAAAPVHDHPSQRTAPKSGPSSSPHAKPGAPPPAPAPSAPPPIPLMQGGVSPSIY